MKGTIWFKLLTLATLLSACTFSPLSAIPSFSASPTPLPTAQARITPAPDARAAVQAYLQALQQNNFAAMYEMLTKVSRETISAEDFAKRYNEALNTMSASSLDFEPVSVLLNPYSAQVGVRVTYHTALVGDLQRDLVFDLALEDNVWKIKWDDGLILPELRGGNRLAMDYEIPARGDIYDRNGLPIVAQAEVYAFGIVPGQITPDSEETLITELSALCGISGDTIAAKIAASAPEWYLPMCEGTKDEATRLLAINPGGLVVTPYKSRYYFEQGVASQITGYTLAIAPEQLDEYRRRGYRGDERIGQAGIEKWAEEYLAGKHGGSLYVVDANGQIVTRLGQSNPQPADSVYLTIDRNLQYYAEQAIAGFRGAVVVLERDSGRVLAMASSPDFDPNLFEPTNPNNALLTELLNDPNQPLVNRATQGQYPLGSVFKIITFSAALESGLYIPETTYDCQYHFTEINGITMNDWTWDHCQDALQAGGECNTPSTTPSGLLTLSEGLMRSCNPYFWHIGLDLYNNNRGNDIANMARAFGLGRPTGIEQVAEASGQINEPGGVVEAVNQAIGQGDVLVTPLQVATFIAAVGNGGTLYRPQLIEKIQPVSGDAVLTFKPEARGTLPLRPDHLKALQDALWEVVHNPRGTANFRLRGLSIPVAGKTGTAESGSGKPHAWFAGYTLAADQTNLPDIAIAVILENAGEGSDYAAPVFKRIVETYYFGRPQSLYWFESAFGVTKTPTPLGGIPTKTPKP
jgi:penicillin-binding protein 2